MVKKIDVDPYPRLKAWHVIVTFIILLAILEIIRA